MTVRAVAVPAAPGYGTAGGDGGFWPETAATARNARQPTSSALWKMRFFIAK